MATRVIFLTTTSASNQTFTVPSNVNSLISVEVIGGGGNGSPNSINNSGGGGGAYAKSTTVTTTPGATWTFKLSANGTGSVSSGNDVWISNTGSAPTTATQGVLAKGGSNGTGAAQGVTAASAAGGAAASCIPTAGAFSGGSSGTCLGGVSLGRSGSGGGGAAGPGGNGGASGNVSSGGGSGASGGGGGAGSTGAGSASSTVSGQTTSLGGTAGAGNGGRGGNGNASFGGSGTTGLSGGSYWTRTSDSSTAGSGGGAGASYASNTPASYGGGGGGSGFNSQPGAQGIIVLTFDVSARTLYWVGGSGTWNDSSTSNWSLTSGGSGGESPPLFFDTVIFNENSGTGTVTMSGTLLCASLNTTGSSFTFSGTASLNCAGNFTLSATTVWSNTGTITISGTSTITTNNVSLPASMTCSAVGATFTLGSNFTITGTLTLSSGTFNATTYDVTVGTFSSSNSATRTVTMGSGTWTLTGTGTVWNFAIITGLTFNKDTANIVLSNTTTTSKTFAPGGLTYNKITLSGGASIGATYAFTAALVCSELASTNTAAFSITTSGSITVTTWSIKGSAFTNPWNFQNILSNSAYSTASVDVDGYRMNYLVAPDSTISGTTPSYTADNSATATSNMILVFRPNTTSSNITVNSLNNYADTGTLTTPASQTITSGSGTSPLVALALYEQCGGGSITTRSFSPAEDDEVTSGTSRFIKYKIYNSAPSNITVGMTSSSGTARGLASFYLQFNGTSSVSFVASSTTGVVPTVQAGDIVVSFIFTGDSNSATPILVPVSPNNSPTTNNVTLRSSVTGTSRTIAITNKTNGIDYLTIRDFTGTNINPITFYAGANSTNTANNTGIAFIASSTSSPQTAYLLTSGTTFTVPSDWNNSNNNIYMIGAGGGGASAAVSGNNRAAGGGGGGGAYTQLTNFIAAPSSSITYSIGTSGNIGANGGNTTWNSGTYAANGGFGGTSATTPTSAGGAGGTAQTVSGIITAAFAGGNGGAGAFGTAASTGYGAGGGGGAGGANGVGRNGGTGIGSSTTASIAGGGGGANGGGSNGGNAALASLGAGGNNFNGTGGATTTSAAGTNGGGGAGGESSRGGTAGGNGIDILNSFGGGGGRGGNASAPAPGDNTGLYGGGGGGAGVTTAGAGGGNGGAGSQGAIFIVYTPLPTNAGNFFALF